MVPSSFTRKFLIVFACLVCVAYLAFRAVFTYPEPHSAGWYQWTAFILLYVAELWGIFNLFLFFVQVWEVSEPPPQPVLEGRTVDVFVPTYNEDVALLRATLEACVRMDYPHKTYVLDDGQRAEVEALARELGINYISRPDNRHFKAGNLNHAFERTDGEFVVVLDADHVPEPHFITRLIGYFRDDRLGYVQTPHAFYNFDSFQARLDHKHRRYWEEGHMFYYVIQPGRNHWGCPIFAGSAAMFRRAAIRDVGLMATETITEDLHTGLRMNAKGWKSLAISERLVAGQAAPDITTFHAQRMRWGTGNLSIFKYDNPLTARGLSLAQRLCYLGSMAHWASGIFKLIIYLTPIAMLFSGIPPVREFTKELLAITIIYLVVSLTTLKVVSNGFGSIINAELFSMVNFWTQIKSTFRAILGLGARQFNVTPKGAAAVEARRRKGVWPFIRPQTYLMILGVLAMFWGWGKLSTDPGTFFRKYPEYQNNRVLGPLLNNIPTIGFGVSDDYFKPVVPTIWVLLHFWLAYKVTQRAFWPADRRLSTRHPVYVPVEYDTAAGTGAPRYGVTMDLNDTGMALVAYERFNPGDVIRLTIRGAGEVVKCKGEVKTVADLTRGQAADGFRYGIQFQPLTPPQTDAINRICLHYGVPRMYGEFDARRGGVLGGLQKRLDRGMAQRRTEFRNAYRLPLVVNSGVTEDTAQFSATEDLSRSAVAALLESELPRNTPVGYLMATPLGEVRGTAKVIRTAPVVYGGRTYYRTVLEFTDYEGQGRTTLHSLVNPHEAGALQGALKPERRPVLVRMAGATLVAVLIAVPLILLQSGLFSYSHGEDRELRNIARMGAGQVPDADQRRVHELYEKIMDPGRNPSSDTLVLLDQALGNLPENQDRKNKQLKVAERLADKNKEDVTLQQALVYAQLQAGQYEAAEATYNGLRDKGNFARDIGNRPIRFWEYRMSGARVAERSGNLPLALERYTAVYQESVAAPPDRVDKEPWLRDPGFYKEVAGVMLKAGTELKNPAYFADAQKVLQQLPPADLDGQHMLAAAYLMRGRAIHDRNPAEADQEYARALRVARDLATQAEKDPARGPELRALAQRMEADVHMAKESARDWEDARAIVVRQINERRGMADAGNGKLEPIDPAFIEYNPAAPRAFGPRSQEEAATRSGLVRRLAQIDMGTKHYPEALTNFALLLEYGTLSDPDRVEVTRGFLDAAAHPDSTALIRGAEQERVRRLSRQIAAGVAAERKDTGSDPVGHALFRDVPYLAQLGRVLHRAGGEGSAEASRDVLTYASTLASGKADLEIRTQLANVLIEANQLAPAVTLLTETRPFQAEMTRAGMFMSNQDWDRAEQVLLAALYPPTRFPVDFVNPDGTKITLKDRRDAELLLGKVYEQRALTTGDLAQFDAAISHYRRMDSKDPVVQARLGHVFLWAAGKATNPTDKAQRYTESLALFTRVLTAGQFSTDTNSGATRSQVELGFIDAAAGAPGLTPEQVELGTAVATRMANRKEGDPIPAVVPAARLAWALSRTGDAPARQAGLDLLEAARAGLPKDVPDRSTKEGREAAQARQELAGVYAASKDYKTAADLLEPMATTVEDTIKLADLRAGARQWDKARAALTRIREDERATAEQKVAARREEAKLTAYAGQHADALRLIEDLVRANQADLEILRLQANVNLWAKNLPRARELYGALLAKNPNDVAVATGFANAVARAPGALSGEELDQLRRLADWAARPATTDALFVARVAEAVAEKMTDPKLALGTDPKRAEALAQTLAQRAFELERGEVKDPIVRREVAYALANRAVGRFKQAEELLRGVELVGEDRRQYALIASQAENYEAARRQARLYLAEHQNPTDPLHRAARRLLADVLTWKGDYEEALAIYNQLATDERSRDLRVQIAEVYRYWQNYPVALTKFAELLGEEFESQQLWVGFIDAASSAPKIDHQRELLLRIYDRYSKEIADPRALSRLAWVMHKLKEVEKANLLLDRAVKADPEPAATRKELAGVLAALDRRDEAITMLDRPAVIESMDITELLTFADLLTSAGEFARAERVLAGRVTESADRGPRVRYGSILLWNGKYPEAQALFTRLHRQYPKDREITLLLGQSYLWAKEYTNALEHFTTLVLDRPDPDTKEDPLASPDVWRGFIDAAAGMVGEALRDYPRRSVGPLFTPAQREAVIRAYDYLTTVRDRTTAQNRADLDRLNSQSPAYPARKREQEAKNEARTKGLAGTMGRLGLLLGHLGERDKSTGAFGAGLAIDRQNRDVWLQYAQTLTALGDDARAKPIFDWLLSNPAQKLPAPAEVTPKGAGNGKR